MKLWMRAIAYVVVGYAGLAAMLMFFENKLVYRPATAAQSWVSAPSKEIQDVDLTCADGTRVHAWFCPCPDSDEALLHCHGNAGNLSHRGITIVKLRDLLKVSVLIIDYPGFGKSGGEPSEQGCYQSVDAAHAWLTDEKKFLPKKIVLYGESLGGGVVTELASRKEHRALVLIKTFTSLAGRGVGALLVAAGAEAHVDAKSLRQPGQDRRLPWPGLHRPRNRRRAGPVCTRRTPARRGQRAEAISADARRGAQRRLAGRILRGAQGLSAAESGGVIVPV